MRGRISAAGGYSLYTMSPPVHAAAFGKLRQRVEEEVFGGFGFSAPGLPVHRERVTRTLKVQGVLRICMAGRKTLRPARLHHD